MWCAHREETHQKKTLEVRLCRNVHNQSLQSSQNRRQNARRLSRHHPWKSCREHRLVHDSVQSCTRKLRDVVHAFNLLEETRAVCPHFQDCWCMEEPPALPQTLGPTHSGAQGGCPLASTQQQYASWSMPIRISVLINSAARTLLQCMRPVVDQLLQSGYVALWFVECRHHELITRSLVLWDFLAPPLVKLAKPQCR